jgi:hypothetical protein
MYKTILISILICSCGSTEKLDLASALINPSFEVSDFNKDEPVPGWHSEGCDWNSNSLTVEEAFATDGIAALKLGAPNCGVNSSLVKIPRDSTSMTLVFDDTIVIENLSSSETCQSNCGRVRIRWMNNNGFLDSKIVTIPFVTDPQKPESMSTTIPSDIPAGAKGVKIEFTQTALSDVVKIFIDNVRLSIN